MGDESFAPRLYLGVMVSSTFRYLEAHRAALMQAIEAQGLHAVAMEQDAALPGGTVVDSSLQKVRDAAAYIGVIGYRYGHIPDSADGNPERLSLTELEFREARRLGRPMLIFIMGPDHDVKYGAVEKDPEKIRKLEVFREEVKLAAGSGIQRVYKEFNSVREFEVAAMQSVAELRRFLDERGQAAPAGPPGSPVEPGPGGDGGIPLPPELYAEPRYIGSHEFVGRTAELETLSSWARLSDPHPVLLYTAIGGTGKSMLTWEWTAHHADGTRGDWAGRLWYSFYDRGAIMADFCRRALAYMTSCRPGAFREIRQPELTERLLQQLQARPWLVVLDGLERILVAYHRYDAAQLADEEAGCTDQIARRDPSAAIRPQDDDLLRALAGASPSKILITSRLIPHALLNPAGQPLPGVRHQHLYGLRPADAEALLRSGGIRGDSQLIQAYLHQHCDCHPLVTGIIAGLVNDYLPDRGHFDPWAVDPAAGGTLNLADVDLVHKRNHILQAALDALPDKDRQFLATLALLSQAVDYDTLTALNPHAPPQPKPPLPYLPPKGLGWDMLSAKRRREAEKMVEADHERRTNYERNLRSWQASPEAQAAPRELARTIRDLERRGLLQYDRQANRYDLHPVIRGYAAGSMRTEDRDRLGQRAVDYFNQQPKNPYEQASTLDDIRNGMQLVKTLLQIGRPRSAYDTIRDGGLSSAFVFNLEAYAEFLSLIRPFFTQDWTAPSADSHLGDHDFSMLATEAGVAFFRFGQLEQALALHEAAAKISIRIKRMPGLRINLTNITEVFLAQYRFARSQTISLLELELAESTQDRLSLFKARLDRFTQLSVTGRWADAEAVWQTLDPMGRNWPRANYRPGDAETTHAQAQFWQGRLTEDTLTHADDLARTGHNRLMQRNLHALRGEWHLQRGEWPSAVESLHEAIRMTREAGLSDTELETRHALARLQLGQLPHASNEAHRLSARQDPAHLALADLWHALGDPRQAAEHAVAAYRRSWADGEPYVHRYDLTRATALLQLLGGEIPQLPAYDPANDRPFPLENQIRAAIQELPARKDHGRQAGTE